MGGHIIDGGGLIANGMTTLEGGGLCAIIIIDEIIQIVTIPVRMKGIIFCVVILSPRSFFL